MTGRGFPSCSLFTCCMSYTAPLAFSINKNVSSLSFSISGRYLGNFSLSVSSLYLLHFIFFVNSKVLDPAKHRGSIFGLPFHSILKNMNYRLSPIHHVSLVAYARFLIFCLKWSTEVKGLNIFYSKANLKKKKEHTIFIVKLFFFFLSFLIFLLLNVVFADRLQHQQSKQ